MKLNNEENTIPNGNFFFEKRAEEIRVMPLP